MTRERPILFNGPMVRAILDGRKTQTRRVCKGQRELSSAHDFQIDRCPYGQPGDRLWVREAWRTADHFDHLAPSKLETWAPLKFAAGGAPIGAWAGYGYGGKIRPGIHMPRWASRITLEVTGVRVDRLQDMSRDDAMEEGCPSLNMVVGNTRQWYADLWDSINGAGAWAANPWVWVVEFRRVT